MSGLRLPRLGTLGLYKIISCPKGLLRGAAAPSRLDLLWGHDRQGRRPCMTVTTDTRNEVVLRTERALAPLAKKLQQYGATIVFTMHVGEPDRIISEQPVVREAVVQQAIGILMHRLDLCFEEACGVLTLSASRANVDAVELARTLVDELDRQS